METVLKKYTTIPAHLYIERQADKQLKKIIEDMQRPGYVLVARQMGKTNLLFNAKRTLENSNRLFAYIDLSNPFLEERDCYRNIINNIIEPNINIFEQVEDEITKIREKTLPPHSEYSRSLISILKGIDGDLVIILDEIDALKSVPYSDNIFAQIRSNYFSRTNYPVLERVTYVLSGVIEPTELIKDKNKSPFNIGDKIYLDDFTKQEHDNFILKSKLNISPSLSEEIFSWTNGNPRLTFDICADVEEFIIQNGNLTNQVIENIIRRKYLTSFDVAPIDHIRELVKSNRDVRKALTNINQNKSRELNDDIKKKLYLYGIIDSKFDEETKIKNKIIAQSLSQDWLKSIDKEYTFVSALAQYSEKQYDHAIETLLNVLEGGATSTELEGSHYFIGLSYVKLGQYNEAIPYFSFNYKTTNYKDDALAFLGVCKIAIGDTSEGISILENAVKKESNTHAYHNALLNLAVAVKDDDKSLALLEQLYNSTSLSEDSDEADLNQLKALSLYYQSDIWHKKNDRNKALDRINKALLFSSLHNSISFKRLQYILSDEKDDNVKTILVEDIVGNRLMFDKDNSQPISFNEETLLRTLEFIYDSENLDNFIKLLNYTVSTLLPNVDVAEILFSVSQRSIKNEAEILNYILISCPEASDQTLLKVIRELLRLNIKSRFDFLTLFPKFYDLFIQKNEIILNDIYLFAVAIKHYSDTNKINDAISLAKLVEARITISGDEALTHEALIIDNWLTHLYFSLKDRINALLYADKTLSLISRSNGKKMSIIDEKGLKSISEQVQQIKTSLTLTIPINREVKKYSRNQWVKVKYLDGREIEKKYKHLEPDILAERCSIISL